MPVRPALLPSGGASSVHYRLVSVSAKQNLSEEDVDKDDLSE